MGLEKKLGLGFVGVLFLTFCGVLTMRLTDTTPEEKVDINIGAGVRQQDAPLAQTPTPANAGNMPFANNRGAAPAQPAEGYAMNNRPTQPNMQTSPPPQAPSYGGGSRYGTSASAQATLPPPNLTSPNIAPPTVSGVPAVAEVERSLANSGYSAPPSAPLPTVAPPSTAVAGANPLRETSSSIPPTAAMPTNDRYASPNIGTASPVASAAAPAASYGASPSTAMTREPRTLDTGAARPQPLNSAATLAPPRTPGVAALAPPGGDARSPTAPMNATPIASAPTSSGSVAPASAVAPVASGRDQPYVVAPGDNLFEISRKVYGDGAYYRALFAYNSDRYPHAEDIRRGNVLDVPSADYLKQRYPELIGGATDGTATLGRTTAAAGSSYTVREGDTLFDIARKQLGQASRWTELYELNRAALGENLENLRPGVTLRLP